VFDVVRDTTQAERAVNKGKEAFLKLAQTLKDRKVTATTTPRQIVISTQKPALQEKTVDVQKPEPPVAARQESESAVAQSLESLDSAEGVAIEIKPADE
jgi:hypothetical protein